MAKLTKRVVDALEPGEAERFEWCDALPGFGVRVYPSGRKVYVVQYRAGGRTRRLTLGDHGPVTADQARARALAALGRVAAGADPAEDRDARKRDLTLAELVERWREHAARTLKPSSRASYESALARHVLPLLGSRKLATLTRRDVERLQLDIAAGRTAVDERTGRKRGRARVRGGNVIAGRAVAYLLAVLSFGVRHGFVDSNPALGVARMDAEKRERFLSRDELARLGEALAAAEALTLDAKGRPSTAEHPRMIAALRLLLLTGARKNEIARLRWAEVDLDGGVLRLADSKTGRRVVPLGAPALAVLAALPRETDSRTGEPSPWVFPSLRPASAGPIVGLQGVWERVRGAAGLPDVRLHDLRHNLASTAAADGGSLFLIGKVLGHRQARMTERYAHVAADPVRAVADAAARKVAAALSAGAPGRVVRLRGPRRA